MAVHALVRVDGPRHLKDTFGGPGPGKPGRALDSTFRRSDERNDDGPEDLRGGQVSKDMRQLGRSKGHDGIGTERTLGGLFGRVCIPARRQIDGHNRNRQLCHRIADGHGYTAQWRLEAGADDRIQYHIDAIQECRQACRICLARHYRQADRRAIEQTEGIRGNALQLCLVPKQHNRNAHTRGQQRSRRHKAITTVVPGPAQDRNPCRQRVTRSHKRGDGRSSALHQLAQRNAEPLGGKPVCRSHLRRREDLHHAIGCAGTPKHH